MVINSLELLNSGTNYYQVQLTAVKGQILKINNRLLLWNWWDFSSFTITMNI